MPGTTRRRFLGQGALVAGAGVWGGRAWGQGGPGELHRLGVAEAAGRIRRRELTSTALVGALLTRTEQLNPEVNAFITVCREEALREAAVLDAEAARGRFRGVLHGVPVAVKDNVDTAGVRTTVGSLVFEDRVPTEDAFVVERLRAAGAVVLGKTNLHEFAMGGTTATSAFGPVHNPWARERVAGGSSGGSAAALAAEMVPGAIGTDTGGSIRIPAAWCGVVGLKPTFGLVSVRGIFPLIRSLDHCGPMGRSVEDVAVLLQAMAGYDRRDVGSVEHAAEDYLAGMRQPVSGLRVGVLREPYFDRLDAGTAEAMEVALGVLRGLVREVREARLPATGALDWTAIRAAEVAAVHEDLFRRHSGSYQLQTRGVVEGTLKELNDPEQSGASRAAALVRAQWQLEELRRTVDAAFGDLDVVVLPTNRVGPRTILEELRREERPEPTEPESLFNSLPFNLYGVPAVSVPCGFSREGLPVGMMLAGPHWSEGRVLALAAAYERATGWGTRRPKLGVG